MDQEVLDARAKLAAKYQNSTQLGGKGKPLSQPFRGCAFELMRLCCRYPKKNQEGGDHADCRGGQEAEGYCEEVR